MGFECAGQTDDNSLLVVRSVRHEQAGSGALVGNAGRCCFHMSECPHNLGTNNEVEGCVPADNWCSHSAGRCTSPQFAAGGCDGTNSVTDNIFCPCLEDPEPKPEPTVEPKPEPKPEPAPEGG